MNMPANRLLELRVYKLHPGVRDAFAVRFHEQICDARGHGIAVVHGGPALHDPDGWTLLRAFPSLAGRQAALDRFYGSEEWLGQHETAVMAMIKSYETAVIDAGPEAIVALSDGVRTAGGAKLIRSA